MQAPSIHYTPTKVTADPTEDHTDHMHVVHADSDPASVLQYDSAGVAINATGNSRMLDNLNEFAGSVKHYSQLMKQHAIAPNGEGDLSDLLPTSSSSNTQNNHLLKDGTVRNIHAASVDSVDPVTLLQYDPAGLAMRTGGNTKLLNELINFAAALTYYVGLVQEREVSAFLKIEEEESDDDEESLEDANMCASPCFLGWNSKHHRAQ